MKKYSTKSIITAVFITAFLVVAFFVLATFLNMRETQEQNKRVEASLEAVVSAENILTHLEQLETQQRGYCFNSKEQFAQPYKRALTAMAKDLKNLGVLKKIKPERIKVIRQLEELIDKKIANSKYAVAMYDSAGIGAAVTLVKEGKGKLLGDSIRSVAAAMQFRDELSLNEANTYLKEAAEKTTIRFFLLAFVFLLMLLIFFFIINNDLQKRRKAAEQLSYQASLIDTVSDAIFSTDPNLLIQSWNKYAAELYGISASEAIGKALDSILTIQLTDKERDESLESLLLNNSYRSEYPVTKKNGELIYVMASINTLLGKQGEITGFVAVHRDITARKLLEDQLNIFNRQLTQQVDVKTVELSAIFERITDGFVALDKDWRYTYVNNRVYQLFGVNPGDFLGKNIWTDFPGWNNKKHFYELYQKAMTSQHYHFQEMYYTPLEIWLESHIYPSPTGLSVYFRNVTQRKKAEEQAKKASELSDIIIDSLPGIFFMYDKETNALIRWNKRVENVTGFSETEMVEKDFIEFIDKKDHTLLTKKIKDAFILGEGELEAGIVTKSGKIIPFYFTAMVVKIEGKAFLIGNGIDISARKEAEATSQKNFNKIQLLATLSEEVSHAENLGQIYAIGLEGIVKNTGTNRAAIAIFNENKELVIVANKGLPDNFNNLVTAFPTWTALEKEVKSCTAADLKNGQEDDAVIAALAQEGINTVTFIPISYQGNLMGKFALCFEMPCTISEEEIQLSETISRGLAFAISEKNAELALIASTHKYQLLFYNNPMPMWMLSYPERNFVDVNEAALLHYGYSRKEFLQMNVKDIRPEEEIENYVREIQIVDKNQNYTGIWRHRKKNGEIIKVEIIAHDIFYEGKNVRLILANNIDEKIKAEEKLQQSYRQIRQLANHLQNIREEERTNISREIHDELGQQLTGLKMYVSWLSKKISSPDAAIKNKFQNTMELIEDTIKSVRKISTELRPSMLDDLGLLAAMEWQSNEFEKRSGIHASFVNLTGNNIIPPKFSTGLFRIFQESLTNVARHADAKKIISTLAFNNNELVLTIADDGRGFVVKNIGSKKTLGLFGMKERTMEMGGSYEIKSVPGSGTTVCVKIPVQ